MIPIERITHAEACAFHRGQVCDCDRQKLHELAQELCALVITFAAAHKPTGLARQCPACLAERRMRLLARTTLRDLT